MIYDFLFPGRNTTRSVSFLLFTARIIFGILFLTHGLQKWTNFQELSSTFPDPIGVGSTISLSLVIFAELACSIACIFGILYRLALIPMIFNMVIAFFVIHSNDPFAVKELAFLYLVVFSLLFIAGPGKFAIDSFFAKILLPQNMRH